MQISSCTLGLWGENPGIRVPPCGTGTWRCCLQRSVRASERKPRQEVKAPAARLHGPVAAAGPCVSHGEESGRGFVPLPIKPCCSLALNSPVIVGSEVGRAALWDPGGREDRNKVDKSKL